MVQFKSNFLLFVQHQVRTKRKEKEQNLLQDQTLMLYIYFNWGRCCGHDRKIDMSRQNNSFEKVDYFNMGQVVWSSLSLISFFLYSIEFRQTERKRNKIYCWIRL